MPLSSEEQDQRLVEAIERLANLAPEDPDARTSYAEACGSAILVATEAILVATEREHERSSASPEAKVPIEIPRIVPHWDPTWSDGCSVPPWLRRVVPLESPEAQAVCREHDHRYYAGGSEQERFRSDLLFALGLLDTRDAELAERYFTAVHLGGGPAGRVRGVSWAWGGEHFRYDEYPAVET